MGIILVRHLFRCLAYYLVGMFIFLLEFREFPILYGFKFFIRCMLSNGLSWLVYLSVYLFHPLISDDDGISSMDMSFSKLQEILRDRKPDVLHPRSQIFRHSLETELQFSCSVMSYSLWPHGLQHTRLPCPSPSPGTCSNTSPSSQWWHPTISSSVVPFYSCLRSFPASGSFPMSQFFASGGRSTWVSASASVLPWIPRTDLL